MGNNSGRLIVVTGPFGAGLKDIVSDVLERRADLITVIPVTARKKKDGEVDGDRFYYYDLEGWNELKETGDLLETTELAGNDYGTSRRLVEEGLRSGKHVLLTIEPERAAQVKQNMPEAFCVYVEPKDTEQLKARYARSARNSFELTARLELAREQREEAVYCDARVDSTDLNAAEKELERLIDQL